MKQYVMKREVELSFEGAREKVRERLKEKGFGVLSEIDVKETLKKKLDVDYDEYVILGACNPPFAYEALKAEKDIGVMLPCNVIVYKDKENTFVSAIDPETAMSGIENEDLRKVAKSIKDKLKEVVESI